MIAALAAVVCDAWAGAYDSIVVFNEIHYHPAGADDPGLEFVELYNQNSVEVDLEGWRLSGGIDYEFPRGTILAGGAYLVVAADPAALEAAAGISGLRGPFTGMLDNGGEPLRIRNLNDRIMDEVEYNDRGAWPVGADGSGASLSKIHPDTTGEFGGHWAPSLLLGGTPGARNLVARAVALTINEIAGSEAVAGGFFVELHNASGQDLDLEGYLIASESGAEYVFSSGASIPRAGHLSIPESVLGFRVADGDNLSLYLAGKNGLLDALRADDLGRTRIPDGTGGLFATGGGIPESPGAPNPEPPVSPVVINEIMYHHRPTYAEGGDPPVSYATNDEEWIELHNTADIPAVVGGWALHGAVRFTLPDGTFIPEGGYLVVAKDRAAFAAKFPGVPVVGDFSGSLSDRGEDLQLLDAVGNPADRVFYRDGKPWPPEADGGGSSLELRNPFIHNSAPEAWAASDNTATASWQDYEFTMRASTPTYTPNVFNFHEVRLGLLDSGVVLVDDFSVVEDPGGTALELIANGGFTGSSGWRLLGTHKDSRPATVDGERVLRIVAGARMNYLNNLIEGSLTSGSTPRPVHHGVVYRVSFRAKWLSGSPQFRFELYYNKLAKTVILRQPDTHGTPGAQNSTYEADTGPIFRGLKHSPAVPSAGESIEVSTAASDPQGIGTMTLRYALNGSRTFASVPMALDSADHLWKGTIPGQPDGTVIQFSVQGQDAGPGRLQSSAPPRGSRSWAIIKVDPSVAHGSKHSIRINMLPNDANALHAFNDILSNYRLGCTIITNEEEIAYDAGIRLRGSMYSRGDSAGTALNLRFPSDRPYRGVHSTITTRRANMGEILVKHIINQAGGVHDSYNDILYQYGHISAQNGRVRSEMARFGSNYLRGLPGGNGTDGAVFKMEGIREYQTTQNGNPDTPKAPFPIGWIGSFDLADQGADKEIYRHSLRINTGFAKDDYAGIIRMCRTFSLNGQELEEAVRGAIDIDQWARKFAVMSLCGIGDAYSQGNPHNFNMYVRPGDGLIEAIPWDWDFIFSQPSNAPLWGNRNVGKVFARPVFARLFYGHLRNIIRTTFNTRYLESWFQHYGNCTGESYTGYLSYVANRGSHVLSQLPSPIPFRITTNDGAPFATSEPTVTLTGEGWINVREVFLDGATDPVSLTWIDGETWTFSAPLLPGPNTLMLTALNHRGASVGSDSIEVSNTGVIEPAGASNLAITEIHYHPAGEVAEEFLEITNIGGGAEVDLGGAAFTDGIDFLFPANTLLAAGERVLLVQDLAAFEARYGPDLRVVGEFANGTRLSNGGERLRLEGLGGVTIRDFTYDHLAPWPEAPDGGGQSLVLVAPGTNPDHADPLNWRASLEPGGTPGGTDAVEFTGDPDGDDNGDGLTNFMNHAFGPEGVGPILTLNESGDLKLAYPRNLAADDVRWFLEISSDLDAWNPATSEFAFVSESAPVNGVTMVRFRKVLPAASPQKFVRLRVEKR